MIIGDTHLPFCHRNYLEFCKEVEKKYKCSLTVHIGDLVDFHAISQHTHDPDGYSPFNELKETEGHLNKWFKAFPECTVMIGNHDERLERAGMKYGLSSAYFKSFQELFGFPKAWSYEFDCYYYGVRFFHGMGYSGKHAHVNACIENQCSIVMGHLHSNFGVTYQACEHNIVFGMAAGSGIDRNSYAFRYGRDFRRKPILGCGVVCDNGKVAHAVPMEM